MPGRFPFEGRLIRLDVSLLPPKPTDGASQAQAEERQAMSRQ